ncbi:D-isomer specific 2-hydroxyacid dehydrogenase [Mycena pura]|uniref:D-isomer specific 2-hydroxyacid dehydrogenase n=1 Tax=Mycena pura TaxID=153505 RepID=A0AAD6UQV2_9AGAR|nr:D-isomer specific 2-hydroxyacid dehydrogenase [Mycena pura]
MSLLAGLAGLRRDASLHDPSFARLSTFTHSLASEEPHLTLRLVGHLGAGRMGLGYKLRAHGIILGSAALDAHTRSPVLRNACPPATHVRTPVPLATAPVPVAMRANGVPAAPAPSTAGRLSCAHLAQTTTCGGVTPTRSSCTWPRAHLAPQPAPGTGGRLQGSSGVCTIPPSTPNAVARVAPARLRTQTPLCGGVGLARGGTCRHRQVRKVFVSAGRTVRGPAQSAQPAAPERAIRSVYAQAGTSSWAWWRMVKARRRARRRTPARGSTHTSAHMHTGNARFSRGALVEPGAVQARASALRLHLGLRVTHPPADALAAPALGVHPRVGGGVAQLQRESEPQPQPRAADASRRAVELGLVAVGLVPGVSRGGKTVARLPLLESLIVSTHHAPALHLSPYAMNNCVRPTVSFWSPVDLPTLARGSDMLFVLAPGGPTTRHLINAAILRQMRPTSILVNNGRGSVVNSAALAQTLADRWICGAGSDVVKEELQVGPEHPLVREPWSAALETRAKMAAPTVRNVLAGVSGERLPMALDYSTLI